MTQKGLHTWDLFLSYHKCPDCGFIMESREDYVKVGPINIKKLFCPRCKCSFTLEKPLKKAFIPFIDSSQAVDYEWD